VEGGVGAADGSSVGGGSVGGGKVTTGRLGNGPVDEDRGGLVIDGDDGAVGG